MGVYPIKQTSIPHSNLVYSKPLGMLNRTYGGNENQEQVGHVVTEERPATKALRTSFIGAISRT